VRNASQCLAGSIAAALLIASACGGHVDTVGHGGGESGSSGSGASAGNGGNDETVDGATGSGVASAGNGGNGETVDGATGALTGAGGSTVHDTSSDAAKAAACEHLFLATHSTRCGGAGLEPDEAKRELALFGNDCVQQFAQPGNGVTVSALEACAAAMEIADCNLVDGPPQACDFRGTLPGAAQCSVSTQCKSGSCDTRQEITTPGGGFLPFECGKCTEAANLGEACPGGGCVAGSACINQSPTSSGDTSRCVAIHVGAKGDPCDELTALCADDLYCSGRSRTCIPLGELGNSCGSKWPTGCKAPNYCDGAPGNCRAPGNTGADCSGGQPCAAGLACDEGTRLCAQIQWSEPGQPCDLGVHVCRADQCYQGSFGGGVPGATGVCPFITGLGESCGGPTHVCDAGAVCYHGKCEGAHSVVCE
jgi:hypothetical protein